MYTVSAKFAEVAAGSHRAVARVRVLNTTQFTTAPTGGTDLPILSGDVKMAAGADVKATLDITIPGDYWDVVQPFGAELFVERGIDYGDGTRELVPLGYYIVEDLSQDTAPYGPVKITAPDRTGQMQQNRVIRPYQVVAGTTHRSIFERLVNGRATSADAASSLAGFYGMFVHVGVPIIWTGYNPDTTTVTGDQVVEDSTYDFLARLAGDRGCVLRFDELGQLVVELADRAPASAPVYAVRPGQTGTLVKASRSVTRIGVYNIVTAYGSDPASPTGYQSAYNNDVNSPLHWEGRFGAAVRYYASPLLLTGTAALAAATTVLGRSTGLPSTLALFAVPNPALRPLDVIEATVGATVGRHVIDDVTIPIAGDAAVQIGTRMLNPVGQVETQADPTPTPPPTTPGPPPPGDNGTEAAVLFGWGPVIDGDEFEYVGSPNPAKWGLYDGAGHVGNGLRRPSAFSVANGVLTCYGDNNNGGTTGGMAFKRGQKYWRLEWRVRTYSVDPAAAGNRYHPVLITWPDSDEWPQGAEYDHFETDCDSGQLGWFIHYPNHMPIRQEGGSQPLDIQNWHNYAFEWTPDHVRGYVDGVQYFDYTQDSIQAPGPMHPTYQLDNFYGLNMNPAKMEAQWLRVYTV